MEEKEGYGTKIYTPEHKSGVDIEGINYWDFPQFIKEAL